MTWLVASLACACAGGSRVEPGPSAPSPAPNTSPAPAPAGRPEASGEMDKNDIRTSFARHRPQLASCYEQHLAEEPTLEGELEAVFIIGPDGAVTSVTATGFRQDIADCVVRIVRDIRFPSPQGGPVTVRYPFRFRPAGQVEDDGQRTP